MNINKNLFDALPIGFFNCLASGSSNRIYSDCLLLIYHEYDREITYRIARSRIRDALAIYLLENHIDYLDDEMTTDRNYNQLANSVIRKFCSKEVGWLEEDTDDATYEKHIMMTEQGVFLAEFLQKMMKPEWEEFSSYIFNIYNKTNYCICIFKMYWVYLNFIYYIIFNVFLYYSTMLATHIMQNTF